MLAVCVVAKDVIAVLHFIANKTELLVLKVGVSYVWQSMQRETGS